MKLNNIRSLAATKLQDKRNNMNHIIEKIRELGVIPVLVIDKADDAAPLAHALLRGGMTIAEVTLRTPAALDAIRTMATVDGLLVGAGTVLCADQARAALAAGAAFLVSPGLDDGVIDVARAADIPLLAGIATATEAQRAWNAGLRAVKYFPAEIAGGAPAVKAFSAVFRDLGFMPTGGVSLNNLEDYLKIPAVIACGGSWIAPESLVKAGKFDEISDRAAQAIEAVQRIRKTIN